MFDFEIYRNPLTGAKLKYDKVLKSFVDVDTKEVFKINQNNIVEFINKKEVAGLNRRNYKTFDGYTPLNQFKARFRFLMFGEESSRRNEYLKYLKVQPFDRVLEVGVGIGTNIMCLSPNARYYGVDSSLTHLNECVKLKFKYRLSLQLCLCSPEKLPFPNDTFDSSFKALDREVSWNKQAVINEMVRVTKPGGIILLVEKIKSYKDTNHKSRALRNKKTPADFLDENLVEDIKVEKIRYRSCYCVICKKKEIL